MVAALRLGPFPMSVGRGSPDIELKDLRTFLAVADAGGFRRATGPLAVGQSVVSKRVRALEDALGVSLFERHQGGVRMTVAGQRFRSDIRLVFSHLDAALRVVRAAGQAGEGSLKIGIVASASSGFFNQLLRGYRASHPGVAIELVEEDPRAHIGHVVGRALDVAVLPGAQHPLGCDVEHLWQEPILVALCQDDSRTSAETLRLMDLSEDKFIVSRIAPGPEIHDFVIQRLGTTGLSLRIEHYNVAREGLMSLVGLGFGVSLISGAEAGVTYPHVAFVPLVSEVLPFTLAWSPDNDNPALRRFLSLARVLAKQHGRDAPSRTPDPSP